MGCRVSGVTCCWLGEWIAARDYLERGLLLYDHARRSSYAELTVDDTHVVLLTYLAWTLLCLGYMDQARAKREAALAEARLLSRAFTLAHALSWATHAEAIVVGPSGALSHANELVSLTERQSIGYYSAHAMAFQGWCLTMRGQREKGITQLTRGLAANRAQGPTSPTDISDLIGGCPPHSAAAAKRIATTRRGNQCDRQNTGQVLRGRGAPGARRAFLVDARRWPGGGVVSQGDQRCAASERENLGTPRSNKPRASLA